MSDMSEKTILKVEDLDISFRTNAGVIHAIRGVNLELRHGETVAIVGESGSGKSVTAKAVVGLLDSNATVNSGKILYRYEENGTEKVVDLLTLSKRELRQNNNGRHIAMVFQDPMTSLDPTMTVVTIQARILELIKDIQDRLGLSVIYITHDLGVVAKVADYVDVMYAGKIIEVGKVNEIFYEPKHPYTWGLLAAMPDLEMEDSRLEYIPGSPPNLLHEPQGDAFSPRNALAMRIDEKVEPPLFKVSDTHYAATWLLHPDAPKVEVPAELQARLERARKEAEKYL